MLQFFAWYSLLTLLGWLTFPLVYRLFPALADRGYSLARTAGLLIWGYLFWLFTSLGLTVNSAGGILFGLLVLCGLSLWAMGDRGPAMRAWLTSHFAVVFTVEILFVLAFAFLAFIRAGNPELTGTERPMELMFIDSILRSPSFPPHDGWLSGYAISYYYFGYVLTAMLAKLTGVPGSAAHNLMTALVFGLGAIGAYGLIHNLLASHARQAAEDTSAPIGLPLLGPLYLLLVSNLGGLLEVLHQRGLFWSFAQPPTPNFWTWLGIRELSEAPSQPLGWMPDRYLWWWRASRVLSDFDLAGNFREVIDEFPFFSFLLGDLHPHVLAIPFNLLAVAAALNLFLGGWRGETNLFGLRLGISKPGFLFSALLLGGLAFLNTWDILIAAALIVLAYVLFRVGEGGWSWSRLEDAFALGLPMASLGFLLYLPFYLGFSSQAGGILPNLVSPTRGAQLWVMFAPLFIPLFAYLAYLAFAERRTAHWVPGLALAAGFTLALWCFSWLAGWLANLRDPALAQGFLASQGAADIGAFFGAASLRRLSYIGGLVTLLGLLVPALAFVMKEKEAAPVDRGEAGVDRPATFALLLIALACLLVLTPEFIYLRDQFGARMNTIFKFYYQAWLLWGIAAAFGTGVLLQRLRGPADWAFRTVLVLVLLAALIYPALALFTKTNDFKPPFGWTLDDFDRLRRENPDEAAAIEWLKTAPDGVLVEAVGGSYTGYGRISTHTGLPSVLGWPGHESQWRGGGAELGTREQDIETLYTTSDWDEALAILNEYNVRYVFVGDLERSKYPVQEDKFHFFLHTVFQQGSAAIYEAP